MCFNHPRPASCLLVIVNQTLGRWCQIGALPLGRTSPSRSRSWDSASICEVKCFFHFPHTQAVVNASTSLRLIVPPPLSVQMERDGGEEKRKRSTTVVISLFDKSQTSARTQWHAAELGLFLENMKSVYLKLWKGLEHHRRLLAFWGEESQSEL